MENYGIDCESLFRKIFAQKKMYKVIAKNRVFYQGESLKQAEETLRKISQMICVGLNTSYQLEDFKIIQEIDKK